MAVTQNLGWSPKAKTLTLPDNYSTNEQNFEG